MLQPMILTAPSCLLHSNAAALIKVANEPQAGKHCLDTHGNHQVAFNFAHKTPNQTPLVSTMITFKQW